MTDALPQKQRGSITLDDFNTTSSYVDQTRHRGTNETEEPLLVSYDDMDHMPADPNELAMAGANDESQAEADEATVDGRSIIFSTKERRRTNSRRNSISIQRSLIMPHKFSAADNDLKGIRRDSIIRAGNDVTAMLMSHSEDSKIKIDYKKKWIILGCSLLCFSSTFHCLFSISALEEDIEKYYDNLNSTEFGSFGTVSFTAAMIAAIIIPYFINKYDLYRIIIFAQSCVAFGQCATLISYGTKSKGLLYIGRIGVGFGLGIDSVSIQALTGLWFRGSDKQTLAFALVGNSIEIGISTALFLLIPTSHATGSLLWPLLIGQCWAIISICAAFYMLYIEHELNKIRSVNDKNSMKTDTNFVDAIRIINKDSNRISIYGIITILFSCKCIADVLFYESEVAYVEIFNIRDSLADNIVSLPSILGLSCGAFLGWIIGKFGQLSMTLIIAMILITFGLFMIAANSQVPWLNIFGNLEETRTTLNEILPWIATGLYAFGLEMFFITGYSSLFQIIPVSVMSVASSLVAILTYGMSMIVTLIFGIIADQSNFSYAFVFLIFIALFGGLGCAIMVHIVDGMNDKRLRQTDEDNDNDNEDVDGDKVKAEEADTMQKNNNENETNETENQSTSGAIEMQSKIVRNDIQGNQSGQE